MQDGIEVGLEVELEEWDAKWDDKRRLAVRDKRLLGVMISLGPRVGLGFWIVIGLEVEEMNG